MRHVSYALRCSAQPRRPWRAFAVASRFGPQRHAHADGGTSSSSPEIFERLCTMPSSGKDSDVSLPILYTGYGPVHGSVDEHAPAYLVKDEAAFQALLRGALRPEPGASCDVSSLPTSNFTTQELQRLLARAEEELAPLLAIKEPIDAHVERTVYPLLRYGCIAVLAVQFVVYFNWVFFVFDWNLVEPTTYFVAYTGVFTGIVYHYLCCGRDDYTWRNLFRYIASRRAKSLYQRKGLDVARIQELQLQVAEIRSLLERY